MTDRNDADALAAARGLTGALEGMTGQLAGLTAYGKRNRRMIWGLIISITLDLILTAFVAVTAIQAHDANNSAKTARAVAVAAAQNNRNLCESSNIARAQQVELWTYLFDLAGPPKTAQGAKLTAEFKHHLQVVFAPRDCSHVNPGKP
jgi:hypothetical protein